MKPLPVRSPLSRRRFLQATATTALASAAGLAARSGAAAANDSNPFAYEVEHLTRTDPKLIVAEEVRRFACPRPDPRRVAVGVGDELLVAAGPFVCVLGREGARVSEIALDGPARCVAGAPDGTVYVGLKDHLEVYDRQGKRLARWDAPGKRAWFSGLALGRDQVFVADSGSRLIWRYDLSGKVLARIGERNPARDIPGFIVPSPYLDVAFPRDGVVRATNPGRHRVELYTPEGDFELAWGKPSMGIEGFCGCCNPIALALLADGRYITCEKGLPRVKVYAADGTFEGVVAGPESFPENARAGSLTDTGDATRGGLTAAVDSTGLIYVLDLVAADIRVMRLKGDGAGPVASRS